MNPQQPDYDFIMGNGPSPKRPMMPSGNSMTQRIIIVVVGLVVLLFILGIVFSIVLGGKGSATQPLLDLAAEQQEIMRVAEIGVQKSTDPSTRSYAYIVKLSVNTDQQKLIAHLKKIGTKVDTKKLNLKKDTKTDTALDSAKESGNFDTVFLETIKQDVATYQVDLKKAYDGTKNKATRDILGDGYNGINTLVNNK